MSKPTIKADDFMNTSLKKATVNKSGGVDPAVKAHYVKVFNDNGGN